MTQLPRVAVIATVLLAGGAVAASWAGGYAVYDSDRKLLGAVALSCFSLLIIPLAFASQRPGLLQITSVIVCATGGLCTALYFEPGSGLTGALIGAAMGATVGLLSYWGLRFRFWLDDVLARRRPASAPLAILSAQDTGDPLRKASGYFLIGLGAPIAAAFLYMFLPSRRGSLWGLTDQSSDTLVVLLTGGGVGVAMVIAGLLILKLGSKRV